jgi:predicted histone-like DNA-binding protein
VHRQIFSGVAAKRAQNGSSEACSEGTGKLHKGLRKLHKGTGKTHPKILIFIMAIKVKAKETLQYVGTYAGTYRYVLMPELYTTLLQDKVIKEAALRSGVSKGVMQACWDAAGEVIKAWATEGHSVALPGLGSMRFGLRAKSVASVDDVKTSLITSRRIIFTPNADLKDELSDVSIQITCIDRDGNEVKRVTSDDDGTVEEDSEGSEDNSGSESGTDSGTTENSGSTESGNSGSTDNTGSTNSGSSDSGGGDNSGGDDGEGDGVMA